MLGGRSEELQYMSKDALTSNTRLAQAVVLWKNVQEYCESSTLKVAAGDSSLDDDMGWLAKRYPGSLLHHDCQPEENTLINFGSRLRGRKRQHDIGSEHDKAFIDWRVHARSVEEVIASKKFISNMAASAIQHGGNRRNGKIRASTYLDLPQ
ncbi:hypothetical protein P153DRAFT_391432 [Dothidotthia symphoricarpi CBS 119687]|uniref:Uncharacterized protein n=1 Tax=Dothidotthia symphoricarpi CBS 119687 TaxID=1392245 RepID=A0A6A5ZX51_9PLEO|nr:uncharacterized protein P153DRAFT_391432 [Dothidotthia symphoricarpi CBS 119687]KAF2123595.1 hypothetical protein P153DRAFT_391432 [Dothidotthia symphoricarpi CBS 119687]